MQKPDESVCVFGAGILKKNLLAFQNEIPGVRLAEDIEFIHRMRVASRRLRSALPLFIGCYKKQQRQTWEEDIRAVTRALGSARDTDVQIEFVQDFFNSLSEDKCKPGVRRLLLRLRQKRERLQDKVMKGLDRLEKDQVIASMQSQVDPLAARVDTVYLFTPALYQLSFDSVSAGLEHFLSYEPFIDRPDRVEELHAMRIAAKQLRYTLEIFTALYPGGLKNYLQIMKQVQDLLGSIHDADIWGFLLPQFIEDETRRIYEFYGRGHTVRRLLPGLNCFLEETHSIRQKNYREFNESWERWRREAVWISLRQTIQTSFLEAGPPPVSEQASMSPQEPTL